MIIIPIRTQSDSHRTPMVNYVLIGLNMLVFLVFNDFLLGRQLSGFRDDHLAFNSTLPSIHQFFTYQFIHADAWHLVGNMLFLWVFGNSVNAKMGDLPYLMFYLAGGVFAAWGFAAVRSDAFQLVGASGAIASVTTAYLVLYPRSRVTVLIWLFFVYFIEVSAMVIILVKIIVWDNILAPGISGAGQVAHGAHLAGYLFGFFSTVVLLLIRALPRDQFDMLALWKRWNRRREYAAVMTQPGAAERAQFGSVARAGKLTPAEQAREDERFNQIADMRSGISQLIESKKLEEASGAYLSLVLLDPKQCMPENQQLQLARELYGNGRYTEAAQAFERFVECYPRSVELGNVMFLLGIVYARDLREYDQADRCLTRTWETLRDDKRREQCLQWLRDVRAALGRPAPEV